MREIILIYLGHRRVRLIEAYSTECAKALAIMRQVEMAHVGSDRHDSRRIDIALAIVARFGVLQIEGLSDAGPLIKLAQIISQIRIILHAA